MRTDCPAAVRAPRNRTIVLAENERTGFERKLRALTAPVSVSGIRNTTICQDLFAALQFLPDRFVDLAFIDPPYNLDKTFNLASFKAMEAKNYEAWLDSWLRPFVRLLKTTASVYICADWRSSAAVFNVARKYFVVRNRITWEREKGRGAGKNWKNSSEDIWFATMSGKYYFDVEAVKLKRRVRAPYTDTSGKPRDWRQDAQGRFRITHPSNLWTDVTVPFWSMPENTDHPTQKPEKLLAKVILASSKPGDLVFDPFAGSGTTSVAAKKLGRRYLGIEKDRSYCCLALKRLAMADRDKSIQGYTAGVFWERNTFGEQKKC